VQARSLIVIATRARLRRESVAKSSGPALEPGFSKRSHQLLSNEQGRIYQITTATLKTLWRSCRPERWHWTTRRGVEAYKKEGPRFIQRLVAKQKARVKDL